MTDENLKTIESQENVAGFLNDLKEILNHPRFNARADLDILYEKPGESDLDPYTTKNTMADLEYDIFDVVDRLLELEVSDYVETMIDKYNNVAPPFYVFGRMIGREVYIKIKIRDKERCKLFCISFHYSRFALNKPYA